MLLLLVAIRVSTYSDTAGGLFNAKKIQFVKIVIKIISSNIL